MSGHVEGGMSRIECSTQTVQNGANQPVDEIHGGLGIIGRQGSSQDEFSVGLEFELGKKSQYG